MNSATLLLLASANFLAAFGGGTILGKAMGVVEHRWIKGGSLLALLVGTPLGLVWLTSLPRLGMFPANGWLCLGGAFASLILLVLFRWREHAGKLTGTAAVLFFIVLCVRFSLWFVPRTVRIDLASGHGGLGWIELLYYVGMVLGLTVWTLLPGSLNRWRIGVVGALTIDSALQVCVSALDFWSGVSLSSNLSDAGSSEFDWAWYVQLTFAVSALTIGTQIVLFDFAHRLTEAQFARSIGLTDQEKWPVFITAVFYVGVALGAITFAAMELRLILGSKAVNIAASGSAEASISIPVLGAMLIGVLAMWAISCVFRWGGVWILFSVASAALVYEVCALAILGHIGSMSQGDNRSGLVAIAFCIIGFAAAISLWIMNKMRVSFRSWVLVSCICTTLAVIVLQLRLLTF